jgi:hypothetical protein
MQAACLLMGGLLTTIGCSDEYKYSTDYSSYDNVTIAINHLDDNGVLNATVGNVINLSLTVTPEGMTVDNTACHIKLDNPELADIEANGTINPKLAGETKLTVTFRGNAKVTTSCTFKVTKDPVPVTDIKVPEKLNVQLESTFDLSTKVAVLPANADDPSITYRSDNPSVATISSEGIITGIGLGTANIYVTSVAQPDIERVCEVRVLNMIPVTGMTLPKKMEAKSFPVFQKINLGEAITVEPSNATDKTMTYTIEEGEGVVSVDANGIITPLKAGDVKLKVVSNGTLDEEVSSEISFSINDTETLFQRILWDAHSNIVYSTGNDYAVDGNNGPISNILDEPASTYAVLTKPGKSYNNAVTPADYQLSIIVDMGAQNSFNYFRWEHRTGNTSDYLRVWGITLDGSDDGETWTTIQENIDLPHSSNALPIDIDLSNTVTYRYVKIDLMKWSDNSGGSTSGYSMQIGGFNVGKK